MVLMGENRERDLPIATAPSRAGLQTVLDVMNIQMKFWPSLATSYSKLLSDWEASRLGKRKEQSLRDLLMRQAAPRLAEDCFVRDGPNAKFCRVAPSDGSFIDACGQLLNLIRVGPSRDVPPPLDDTVRSVLYKEYALCAARVC